MRPALASSARRALSVTEASRLLDAEFFTFAHDESMTIATRTTKVRMQQQDGRGDGWQLTRARTASCRRSNARRPCGLTRMRITRPGQEELPSAIADHIVFAMGHSYRTLGRVQRSAQSRIRWG